MTSWLSKNPFLIGLLSIITAGVLYYVSFNGLRIGINSAIEEMAVGYALVFQLVELIGLSLKFAGKLKPENKTDKYIYIPLEITLYLVLIVDFLMVFLGYQGFNNIGTDPFNQTVIVSGRLIISLLASVFPEILTIFGLLLWAEAYDHFKTPKVTRLS